MTISRVKEGNAHELVEAADAKGSQTLGHHESERGVLDSIAVGHIHTARESRLREHLLGGPKINNFDVWRDGDTGREITF